VLTKLTLGTYMAGMNLQTAQEFVCAALRAGRRALAKRYSSAPEQESRLPQ
jgi:hypothetical protein